MEVHSYRIIVVVGTFVIYLLSNASLQVMGVYMTPLSEEFNVGSAVLGWICSLSFATQCLAGPVSSVIINTFGYRWSVMAGGIFQATGLILTYFATSVAGLFICLGVVPGIGASLIFISVPTIIASNFTQRYSTVIGIVFSGIAIGIIVLPPLIDELIASYGWRGAILIHGALLCNNTAMGALFKQLPLQRVKQRQTMNLEMQTADSEKLREVQSRNSTLPNVDESQESGISTKTDNIVITTQTSHTKWYPSHLMLFINTPMIALVYLASFFVNVAFTASITHISNQVIQSGYSEKKGALVLSLLGIGSLFARAFLGLFVDTRVIAPTTLYELTLLFAAAATFINPIANSYIGNTVSATCIGLATGILFPSLYVIMLQMVGRSQLATAVGMELFIDCWAIMLGGYSAGAIRDLTGNYNVAFYTCGAIYLFGAGFFFPVVLRQKFKKTTAVINIERETNV